MDRTRPNSSHRISSASIHAVVALPARQRTGRRRSSTHLVNLTHRTRLHTIIITRPRRRTRQWQWLQGAAVTFTMLERRTQMATKALENSNSSHSAVSHEPEP